MACANKDRYRSKIVNFRMTIEEAEELDAKVALSGLPKQKYIADCVLNHRVRIVCGKKAVRAMQMYLEAILEELQFLEDNQKINYLSRNKEVRFKYNEVEYAVRIVKVSVFPQCYSAVADMLSTFPRKVAIIDIGSWTVDIMPVINKKPDDQRCNSLPHGIITCMRNINRACIKKFNFEMDEMDIEHYIRYQQIANVPSEVIKLMDNYLKEYANSIVRSLKEQDINVQTTPVIFVGGGAVVMKNYCDIEMPNVEFRTDIKANAKGYETLAKMALKGGVL